MTVELAPGRHIGGQVVALECCPGCGRLYASRLGLDGHRRHPAAAAACRYPAVELERRIAYRPGWLGEGRSA